MKKTNLFKPPQTYRFEVTITHGNDEWWEMVERLPTVSERRRMVRDLLVDTLPLDIYRCKVKILPNLKPRRRRSSYGEGT